MQDRTPLCFDHSEEHCILCGDIPAAGVAPAYHDKPSVLAIMLEVCAGALLFLLGFVLVSIELLAR